MQLSKLMDRLVAGSGLAPRYPSNHRQRAWPFCVRPLLDLDQADYAPESQVSEVSIKRVEIRNSALKRLHWPLLIIARRAAGGGFASVMIVAQAV